MEDTTPLWHNNQRKEGAKALQPDIRLFLESHPQKVADLGSDFGLAGLQNTLGLTAILVPDSNTMADRTPLWHNNQRQVGAERPLAMHQVVSGVAPSKSC